MNTRLGLNEDRIQRARSLAEEIAHPVRSYIERHTTVSVERATLRLFGLDGCDEEGTPTANLALHQLRDKVPHGAARYLLGALVKTGMTVEELDRAVAEGFDLAAQGLPDQGALEAKAAELVARVRHTLDTNREYRLQKIDQHREREHSPLLYVIVATGNIYEDVKQARAVVYQGADIVAVIRTTAQSLLDYVPHGATTEGFGGTYATRENFRIMRKALDEAGEKVGRYIRLVNYASGLCMPEIAALGALERLDMMLNDSMYGILFRDINMYRTLVDQHFSRMVSAYADIVINTGEDNYLTTSDAYEKGYTVLASELINERLAFDAGMPSRLQGLGHAFEMDPAIENGFLYELAQAALIREVFPSCPLKYMPPTKHMTGNIFAGYALNTLFNLVARMTGQEIILLGMLTEAIHTPFMQDRFLAIQNALYVFKNAASLGEDISFRENGIIRRRAAEVLDKTVEFLEIVAGKGIFESINQGLFADIKRSPSGGKGFDGVYEKAPDYWNPWENMLKEALFKGGKK
ncbi:MAG: lysine 5,6-aminomutase subunit alpha [Spirochaetales bacterium]|nr:lysine 5,6-aminomutase subunit alpha [Spirochaetales bacterium]